MTTEKFRRQLRQEAEHWWQEGWIDASLYERLSERYQFNQIEGEASNRFVAILLGLGAVLLGLGAITFVAANWQEWSRMFRVILLLSCFVAVNAAGFYLWRRPTSQKGFQRLGHALLLLGALLLGANMGLMSQMFHQSGDLYELFVVWALGVAVMAYSLRLTSLGVLALILMGSGYLMSLSSGSSWQEFSWTNLLVLHMPLFAAAVFLPLAHWCRSRAIFGLSAVLIATSLTFNLRPMYFFGGFPFGNGWLVAIAFVLPPALLWSYSDRIWQRASTSDPFQPLARSLAIWYFSLLFYWLAFRTWWSTSSANYPYAGEVNWQPLIDVVLLSVVAGLGWLKLSYELRRGFRFQERSVNSGLVAIFLAVTALLFLLLETVLANIPEIGILVFNSLLFVLALALIRDGLAMGSRSTFWGGMVLLVLSIITRMLEYNTELLFKSIVFALCGVGIIAAGLWFERNVKGHHRDRALPTNNPSQEGTP
jgi:uncharacterized membrane protein